MTTKKMSRDNAILILQALRNYGALSRAQVAESTGLSLSTVGRLITSLAAKGVVEQLEDANATGGRPVYAVQLRAEVTTTLAVDVSGAAVDLALVGLNGQLLARWIEGVPDGLTPAKRIVHTISLVEDYFARVSVSNRCVAVGISVPGPVSKGGWVRFAPALEWHDVPLGDLIRQRIGVPVTIGNDANLIAVAESQYGCSRRADSLVVLAVFEGVGAGIVVDGRLWSGHAGASGQLGRTLLSVAAVDRVYAGFGDLEQELGSVGLARRVRESGQAVSEGEGVVTALFGNERRIAETLPQRVLDEFAAALVNVCALIDPEVVVLAGWLEPHADRVAPQLTARLAGRVINGPRIHGASTQFDGKLLGAAAEAFECSGSLRQLVEAGFSGSP